MDGSGWKESRMPAKDLRTVKQVIELRPSFTESMLRGLIFRSEENGLDRAIVKIGRRVHIDLVVFDAWIEAQRLAPVDE